MIRLGMLVPSSNTVVEPVCARMVECLRGVSVHFSRFRVTEIGLSDRALRQFHIPSMLEAAKLVADAKVRSICWNGTSGGWLGVGADVNLCEEITRETGVPATSATLALIEALKLRGARRLGLVTPYTEDVQARIAATLADVGVEVVAEAHFGLSENESFARIPVEELTSKVRNVAASAPDAVTIFCTNILGADLAPNLERELRLPILDSVALSLGHALWLAGGDPDELIDWGSGPAHSLSGGY